MNGVIHSVNVSQNGGVPKLPVRAAIIRYEGVEGDHNRFRTERKEGDPGRAVNIFSLGEYTSYAKKGTQSKSGLLVRT